MFENQLGSFYNPLQRQMQQAPQQQSFIPNLPLQYTTQSPYQMPQQPQQQGQGQGPQLQGFNSPWQQPGVNGPSSQQSNTDAIQARLFRNQQQLQQLKDSHKLELANYQQTLTDRNQQALTDRQQQASATPTDKLKTAGDNTLVDPRGQLRNSAGTLLTPAQVSALSHFGMVQNANPEYQQKMWRQNVDAVSTPGSPYYVDSQETADSFGAK